MTTPTPSDTASGGRRARRLALLALAVVLWILPLPLLPLLEPDEGRYGEIPREMLASGDFLTPRLAETLYFEKPPLHYWLTAAALRLLGPTELAVRFWTALLGLATAAVVWALGRALADRRCAALAVGLLLASPYFYSLSHLATLDMTLSCFVTVALAGFWIAQRDLSGPRAQSGRWGHGDHGAHWGWWALFGGAALAVMTKGLIGAVLPGAVIFLYLLVTGEWGTLRRVPWVRGTLLFLAIAAPWHVAMAREHPIFLQFYFVHEHFLRYATPVARRAEPFWYFFAVLGGGCLPWTGLLPALGRLGIGRSAGAGGFRAFVAARREVVFLVCWAAFPLLFFSASHSKLAPYVLPSMPPLVLLVALAFSALVREETALRRNERWGLILGAMATAAVALAGAAAASGRVPGVGERAELHLLPMVLGLAATLGAALLVLRTWTGEAARLATPLLSGAALLTAMLWTLAAVEAPSRSSRAIADYLAPRLRPGDRVICVGGYRQSLPFYLGRVIDSAGPHSDLEFGVSQLDPEVARERFPNEAELRALWLSPQRVYLVVDRDLDRLRSRGLEGATLLLPGKRMQLVVNHPLPGG